jgi:hypothetical protein
MTLDPRGDAYAPPAAATEAPTGTAAHAGSGTYRDERRSVPLLVVLTILTLGFYPAVWFLRRRDFLDARDARKKLGPLAAAPLVVMVILYAQAFVALPAEAENLVNVVCAVVSLVAAYRVAAILRSDFARTGRFLKVSGAGTFFFNALYFQYKINQAADMPARGAPRDGA